MIHTNRRYSRNNAWYMLLAVVLSVCMTYSIVAEEEAEEASDHSNEDNAKSQNQTSSEQDIDSSAGNSLATDGLKYILHVAVFGILFLSIWNLFAQKSSRRVLDSIKQDVKSNWKISREIRSQCVEHANHYLNLGAEIKSLRDELKSVQTDVKHLKRPQYEKIASQATESNFRSQERHETTTIAPDKRESQADLVEEMSPALRKFCNLYNASRRSDLLASYANYRIGVKNAHERRSNLSREIPPIFESQDAGDFWAFCVESQDLCAVVPVHGLVLQEFIYGIGAFGEVFECPNFSPGNSYHVTVIQPATFKAGEAKQSWILQEKGKLKLELIT